MILDDLIRQSGHCPCDPTRGQSCRYCDGTDAEDRETRDFRRNAVCLADRDGIGCIRVTHPDNPNGHNGDHYGPRGQRWPN